MFQISLEKQKEINLFLEKHLEEYSEMGQYAIKNYLFDGISGYDYLLELYTYFQAIDKELDYYELFASFIKEKINNLSQKKIIEVGSGPIPVLANILMKNNCSQIPIDVYDPALLSLTIKGLVLHKKEFTKENNLKADLYIGMCPCDGLEVLIKKAIETKKELVVQTCSCGNINFSSRRNFYYYIDSLLYLLEPLKDEDFIVEKDFSDFSRMIDAPILLARKRLK